MNAADEALVERVAPCPFCGGPAKTHRYNGTMQATCAGSFIECAGSDVEAPIAMWNRRAALSAVPEKDKGAGLKKWRWRSRVKGGAWDAWEQGRYGGEVPPFMEVEEQYALLPASGAVESGGVEVEREACAKVADGLALSQPEHGTFSAEYCDGHSDGSDAAQAAIAAAILARGQP